MLRALGSFLFLATVASSALAQPAAEDARLIGLTMRERALLAAHLDRGPVGFVTFDRGELPEIVIASRVDAPAEALVDLLREPSGYGSFMPALDRVDVRSRQGNGTDSTQQIAYDWSFRAAILVLEGRNVLTYSAIAPELAAERGHQIEIRSLEGAMGTGRMLFKIYPEAPNRSLLVLASRLDFRDGNYLFRQMATGGGSVTRSINIAVSYMMVMGAKDRAEGRSPIRRSNSSVSPLTRPDFDMTALAPLLRRGDLVTLDFTSDGLPQVNVAGRSGESTERVRRVMTDPGAFGRSLINGSEATIVSRDETGTVFEWEVPTPLIGGSGQMKQWLEGTTVCVDGVEGNMHSSRFRFDTFEYNERDAAIIGWSRFDPAEMSWLIRRLVEDTPYFGEGLTMAGQLLVMRSVRASSQ